MKKYNVSLNNPIFIDNYKYDQLKISFPYIINKS